MTPNSPESIDEHGLAGIVAEYKLRVDSGEAIDQEQFIQQHPEAAAELRAYFANSAAERQKAETEGVAATITARGWAGLGSAESRAAAGESTDQVGQGDTPQETLDYTPHSESDTRAQRPRPRVPGFQILNELGRGGTGVVYRARQIGLNRIVALKMILGGEHAQAEDIRRFRMEAEAVARFQHPNIVQIHEIGEQNGLEQLSKADPANARLRRNLAEAEYGLAASYTRLGNPAAADHHQAALKLRQRLAADDPTSVEELAGLLLSLASCGQHEEAHQLAEALRKSDAPDGYVLHKVAAGLALCATAVARQQTADDAPENAAELIESYSASAVEALRSAVAHGQRLTAETALDPDFEALHARADFQELID